MHSKRDHGGGIDAAMAQYGGSRAQWLDLSTGINPVPFPLPDFSPMSWETLPDRNQFRNLEAAARKFWNVPESADILAAPGASALIARIPHLDVAKGVASVIQETYNEHAAAFRSAGWEVDPTGRDAYVTVHPNNPTAEFTEARNLPQSPLTIIDESFCDVAPDRSLMTRATLPGTIILKSFGKFWGLAGMRLGFAIGDPALIAQLRKTLGPWQVSGPAITTGIAALSDPEWAKTTRQRLASDAARLDGLLQKSGAKKLAGTTLFQLYHVDDAKRWQDKLARGQVLSRIFPYSENYFRLGLPAPDRWQQLEDAL